MDLSKAFDTIPHSLLLAKLKAYGLSDTSSKLLDDYLRAEIRKYRESADRSEKTIFFFFHQKNPFG